MAVHREKTESALRNCTDVLPNAKFLLRLFATLPIAYISNTGTHVFHSKIIEQLFANNYELKEN